MGIMSYLLATTDKKRATHLSISNVRALLLHASCRAQQAGHFDVL
jgi:hypothetical protein